MKPASDALQSILDGNQFVRQELYTITLAGGTVLRFGDYHPALPTLIANGQSFPTSPLGFKRGHTHQGVGLQTDTMEVEIHHDPRDGSLFIANKPFPAFVQGGGLDGAFLQLDRCFMLTWGDCQANGTVPWFLGRIADVECGRTKTTLTVKSLPELLNQTMPPDVYQPGCLNTLFDTNCTLNKASFAVSGTVTGGGDALSWGATGVTNPAGYFTLGSVVFTSGLNAGAARSVRFWSGPAPSVFITVFPFPTPPQIGDTFIAYPGCDKLQPTCVNKFANGVNFRGERFIPPPETAR